MDKMIDDDIKNLKAENSVLKLRVQELLEANVRLVEEKRLVCKKLQDAFVSIITVVKGLQD